MTRMDLINIDYRNDTLMAQSSDSLVISYSLRNALNWMGTCFDIFSLGLASEKIVLQTQCLENIDSTLLGKSIAVIINDGLTY